MRKLRCMFQNRHLSGLNTSHLIATLQVVAPYNNTIHGCRCMLQLSIVGTCIIIMTLLRLPSNQFQDGDSHACMHLDSCMIVINKKAAWCMTLSSFVSMRQMFVSRVLLYNYVACVCYRSST